MKLVYTSHIARKVVGNHQTGSNLKCTAVSKRVTSEEETFSLKRANSVVVLKRANIELWRV